MLVKRPFRIDVNHVPVRGRQVAVQIELDAVHPFHVGGQRAQIRERGSAASMLAFINGPCSRPAAPRYNSRQWATVRFACCAERRRR